MKKFEVDGIIYNREAVTGLRKTATDLRDEALKVGAMDWTVSLSHIIVVLNRMIEELEA